MATHREAAALSPQDTPYWTRAHEALSRLAHERARLDAEEGPWLLRALRSGAHVHMGCGSFWQYIEQLFGYEPRTTQDKLRVAEALEGLPRLNGALTAGALGWSAVRELTRVALPETEQAWLEAARGKTQRELEVLVAHKSPGDAPDAPGTGARRHVLRFEIDADTFATFREAMQRLDPRDAPLAHTNASIRTKPRRIDVAALPPVGHGSCSSWARYASCSNGHTRSSPARGGARARLR